MLAKERGNHDYSSTQLIGSSLKAHLEEGEFFKIFGMSKSDFYNQKKAKQIEQKIKHKLF